VIGFREEVLSGVDMRIRRVLGLGCAVLLAVITSTLGHAGGWTGFQHPGYPFASGATSFYVGYFSDPTGLTLSFQNTDPGTSLNLISQTVAFQGVWFELLAPIKSCGPLGMVVGANYHFPVKKNSQETINTGGVGVNSTWNAAPQWGGFQLALTYQINPALTAILGFKYQSLLVNLYQSVPANPNTNTADISINEYLPYFGFAYKAIHPTSGLELETALIGFPTVLGALDFRETIAPGFNIGGVVVPGFRVSQNFGSGRFLEWFAEVSLPVRECCRLGSFVRYNVTQASGTANPAEYNGAIPSNVNYDFNLDKRIWAVGGVVSFSF
jgi:hypothetical protein